MFSFFLQERKNGSFALVLLKKMSSLRSRLNEDNNNNESNNNDITQNKIIKIIYAQKEYRKIEELEITDGKN